MAAIKAEKPPVEWFILSTEAILEIDITAVDMLKELHQELSSRQIVFALARVKQELYAELQRAGLIKLIGCERIYPTLHTAIEAFYSHFN